MEAVPVKFVPRGYGDTYRRDAWWVEPLVVFLVLGGFVVYATWAADGTTFIGPANITEVVTILNDGDSYKGTFQLTQYDATGTTPLGGPSGVVVGTRIKP